jgi:hypothetical protein
MLRLGGNDVPARPNVLPLRPLKPFIHRQSLLAQNSKLPGQGNLRDSRVHLEDSRNRRRQNPARATSETVLLPGHLNAISARTLRKAADSRKRYGYSGRFRGVGKGVPECCLPGFVHAPTVLSHEGRLIGIS